MTKHAIESEELYNEVMDYLKAKGAEVDGLTIEEVFITTPGGAKTPRRCLSGSGLMTSGGRFAPGYDAKAKAALYAIIRGKTDNIPAELVEHGPFYIPLNEWTPEKATAKLREMGWPDPAPKPEPKPKKEKAEKGDSTKAKAEKQADTSTKAGRRAAVAKQTEAAKGQPETVTAPDSSTEVPTS